MAEPEAGNQSSEWAVLKPGWTEVRLEEYAPGTVGNVMLATSGLLGRFRPHDRFLFPIVPRKPDLQMEYDEMGLGTIDSVLAIPFEPGQTVADIPTNLRRNIERHFARLRIPGELRLIYDTTDASSEPVPLEPTEELPLIRHMKEALESLEDPVVGDVISSHYRFGDFRPEIYKDIMARYPNFTNPTQLAELKKAFLRALSESHEGAELTELGLVRLQEETFARSQLGIEFAKDLPEVPGKVRDLELDFVELLHREHPWDDYPYWWPYFLGQSITDRLISKTYYDDRRRGLSMEAKDRLAEALTSYVAKHGQPKDLSQLPRLQEIFARQRV